MKILLIQPALELDRKYGKRLLQTLFRPAPITLPTIAALTPPEHEVEIVDDAFMDIPFDADVGLVGITGSTPFAVRMREIAEGFRARGVKVVVGGVYATLCPDEVAEFADAVVVGDAEDTWATIIEDVQRGELKPRYLSARPPLTGRPFPRRELLRQDRYILPTSFQFSRGCVHSCAFCSINLQYGNNVRIVPVEAAIADIRQARKHRVRPLIFWDDNLFNSKKWAREFFIRLADLDVSWIGQSTQLLANDPEMLELASKSGCKGLFLGLESFSQGSLAETNKGFNKVERYREQFKKIHDAGISIQAGIIFGFDEDDPAIFERTLEAAIEIKLDFAAFSLLVPYPGMPLYRKLEREGRIIVRDLSKYDSDTVVFRPAQMSPEDLQEGWHWIQHQFYSVPNIFRRTWGRGSSTRLQIVTNFQYNWFTKLRFPRGYNPARRSPSRARAS